MPNNLYIVGLMGSGKSTIGKILAKKLHQNFVDSDDEIVQRNGVDIQTIFELEGESGFRDREQQVIKNLSELDDHIVATGGGAILRLANRLILSETGVVIYLESSVDALYTRTKKDTKRPLLQTENPKQKLRQLYQERDHLYQGLADKVIYTDNNKSSFDTAKQILNFLKFYEKTNG